MPEDFFETATTSERQYGALYPDGRVDWNVRSWFGSIDTPERRRAFAEQYRLQMASFGITNVEAGFVEREVTTTYSPASMIVDPEPTPEPTPEPEPSIDDSGDEAVVNDQDLEGEAPESSDTSEPADIVTSNDPQAP